MTAPQCATASRWHGSLSLVLVGLVIAAALAAGLVGMVLPAGDPRGDDGRRIAAGIIFIGSYLALAIGRIPGLNIDPAGIGPGSWSPWLPHSPAISPSSARSPTS